MAKDRGLDPDKSLLLIIDVQERLLAAMNDEAGARMVKATSQLAVGANALAVPVVVTEQYPKGLGRTVEELKPFLDRASFTEKTRFDASATPTLTEALRDRSQVIVAGLEAHICVHQTVRGLVDAGFEVHVASDATCSRASDNHRLAELMWRRSGAHVSCAETILFDWLGEAGGDAFKTISAAVR